MISSFDFLTCSNERYFMSQWDIGFKFNFEQDFHYKYGFFTAFLFQILTLIFRYKNCKQRLHVHLGDREYRRLLLGVPQTPSFGKRNELVYNNITSSFGSRTPPKQGASSDHKGIDIGASMGAQVIAAAAGKVTTVSYNSARGYFIVVDHGNGYVTLYQHLSRQDVKVGDMVRAGQQIGAVGETGISTAPHLHFEVHVNGTPVNPLQFFE